MKGMKGSMKGHEEEQQQKQKNFDGHLGAELSAEVPINVFAVDLDVAVALSASSARSASSASPSVDAGPTRMPRGRDVVALASFMALHATLHALHGSGVDLATGEPSSSR